MQPSIAELEHFTADSLWPWPLIFWPLSVVGYVINNSINFADPMLTRCWLRSYDKIRWTDNVFVATEHAPYHVTYA